MRNINAKQITRAVKDLCVRANLILRPDVLRVLKAAARQQAGKRAGRMLNAMVENAGIAKREGLAICQDTGLPLVFLEIGQDVHITGDLKKAVNKGVEAGYRAACLRNSVIADPLKRGHSSYTPALIHTDIVPGSRLKVTVMPKGFGCENKSALMMLNPTAGEAAVRRSILETVKKAGPDACPPYTVGVGIGGTADHASYLAKKALLLNINSRPSGLERKLLADINKLNIGPMGLGGKPTCLGVSIITAPTHIAGLPVAVNISCHALRSAQAVL